MCSFLAVHMEHSRSQSCIFRCFCTYTRISNSCVHLPQPFRSRSAQVNYIQAAHQKKHLDVLVASLGPAVIPTEGYKQPAREATLHVTSRAVIQYLIGEERCLELGVLDREEDDDTPEMYGFVLLNQEKGAVKRKRENHRLPFWCFNLNERNASMYVCRRVETQASDLAKTGSVSP